MNAENNPNQVLVLLPEIALTTQLIKRFEEQFNFKPAIWHSGITKLQKNKIFKGVISGETRIVIGTRSSLFLPFKNLKLIIVDEEHDQSYKQTEGVSFNARNIAIMRAKLNNIPIILASATPSIETLINVESGKYKHLLLTSRFGNAVLPDIEIIDLRKEKLKRNNYLSTPFKKALLENLQKGQQSIIFLNRRGYAPIVLCADCGEKIQCPNCQCNLTYHKKKERLICHHCDFSREKPKKCEFCNSENLIDFGPGVEKIEKEVQENFPTAKTIILSSDTLNTPKKMKEVIAQILNNEVDIIIGTQLIAKGHHFPNLTLVGVVDSDASLYGGDIKAGEKTYQLLTQVAGRAGREEVKGKVYLQSYSPDNLILQALKKNDKEMFLKYEKENRKLGNFPPFGKMSTISVIATNEMSAYQVAKSIFLQCPINEKIEIFGPAPVQIIGKHKFNIILKTAKDVKIQELVESLIKGKEKLATIYVEIE